MTLEGRITISRPSGSNPYISITIADDRSSTELVEVRIPLAEFAEALTGMGHVPCSLRVGNLERIGKVHEHKTERVPLPRGTDPEDALRPFEVDGWTGSRSDVRNHHRNCGTYEEPVQSVGFERWVPTPTGEARRDGADCG